MAETKKLLVPFDAARPRSNAEGYLIPSIVDGQYVLVELTKGRPHAYGLTVYVGRAVTENDLFARMVDSGAKISSVDETLSRLRRYVEKVQSLHIGNVVRVRISGEESIFELDVVARTPSGFRG